MKNILLLSNIYPTNDPNYFGTAVCHSFTSEWAAMGHNVRVVHFDSLFPQPYYWVAKLFTEQLQAKTGAVVYTDTPHKPVKYKVDNIPVLFIPLRKLIPHQAPSKKQISKAFVCLCKELDAEGFLPDVITAHFVLPQLLFMPLLKQKYPNAKTCLVPHGLSNEFQLFSPDKYREFMKAVDVFGFRSLAFKNDFEKNWGKEKPTFLCLSGIPEKYIEPVNRDFKDGVKRFAFVGSLLELKNVDVTLKALHKSMVGKDYTFDIVGSGAENDKLHRIVDELGMGDHVVFHGQKKRDEAQRIVKEADCFIMVSAHEAFGLVYVEAMAKGCIVVGTEGQGIDGVVINGENGFLCKAGDVDVLAKLIDHIVSLPQEKLKEISDKAVATAADLTDRKVAEHYLDAIINS